MKIKRITFIIGLFCTVLSSCTSNKDYQIIISPGATPSEVLASREIRRYIYLRTDILIPIIQSDIHSRPANSIVVAGKDQGMLKEYVNLDASAYSDLQEQEFVLKSVPNGSRMTHFIIGGGASGVLYGAYQFAEKLGVRYYLHGDVIPDEKQILDIPSLDEKGSPLFDLRGILPFHDFPEGPDWWNLEEYKAIIGQLVRLKMNFVGFHTYPEVANYPSGYCQAEPLVWIGPEQDVKSDGSVTSGYPVLHFNTRDNTWGYNPMKTSEFHCGAAGLFEEDYFGASYMMNASPWPPSEEENIRVFNEMGNLLADAFSFARELDIRTCIGTETSLTVPSTIQNRFRQDKGMSGENLVREMYKGMFTRITRLHSLDYFWLWTNEVWTWNGTTSQEVRKIEEDMLMALSALKEVNAPFTLATCGWVLGPPDDPTRFDNNLPKDIPFSCINREVGFSPVEPSFANLSGRPKWAIPWMEDDPALISPQLWAGRMRKDAEDALKYGCTGLMGIHWRTKILGPNVSALAAAGWNIKGSEDKGSVEGNSNIAENSSAPDNSSVGNNSSVADNSSVRYNGNAADTVSSGSKKGAGGAGGRDLPVNDFYQDWAKFQFGPEASDRIAGIFVSIDGGPMYNKAQDERRRANLYRFADWQGGPGGILTNKQPWEVVRKNYAFIDELENIRMEITGKGNLDRFDYWLNTFRYARSAAHFGCIMGQADTIISTLSGISDRSLRKEKIKNQVLPLRIQATMTWVEMMNYLLQTVSTTGEMGTVANLEQHNLGLLKCLNKYDSLITDATGQPLPPEAELSMKYFGPLRIIVPAIRNVLEADEDFTLRVILLSGEPIREAYLYWKNLGEKQYNQIPLTHVNRGVYKLNLTNKVLKNSDFEYYIEAVSASSAKAVFPATAPEMNQTVVSMSTIIE
jgi:hypothetical protein